jgi:hypothetical protein
MTPQERIPGRKAEGEYKKMGKTSTDHFPII